MKKLVSLILAIFLLASMTCVPALAATGYTINGVNVSCESSSITNNCWSYAREIYIKLWGYGFTSSRATNDNMLSNLGTAETTLTAEHLKTYIQAARPGAVIRICPASIVNSGSDSSGHSQILVSSDSNGFRVFESNMGGTPRQCNWYAYDKYASYWAGKKGYTQIKYIKYKDAPAYTGKVYALDVNGFLDGGTAWDLSNYGLFDIEVGGKVYENRNDFYSDSLPEGTQFRIYNIRPNGIHDYQGVRSCSGGIAVSDDNRTVTGTVSGENKSVMLSFRTNNLASEYKSTFAGEDFYALIKCNGNGLYLYEQDDYNITLLPKLNNDDHQIFHFERIGDNRYRIAARSGRVIDVSAGSAVDGANLQTWLRNDTAAQSFAVHIMNGGVELSPLCSFGVIDGGLPVSQNYFNAYILHHMDGNANQIFTLEPATPGRTVADGTYCVTSGATNFAIDMEGWSGANGGRAQVWGRHSGENQQLVISYIGDGFYRIKFKHSGRALDLSGGGGAGSSIIQWDYHGGANQLWRIEPCGDGTYRFISAANKLVIDIRGGEAADGVELIAWEWHGESNQRFVLNKV